MTATPEPPTAPTPRADAGRTAAPRLADGIELVGEYKDSGFKEPPYIARRADGQVIQLPRLLYLVAEQVDGRRGVDEIAERVGQAYGRPVTSDNVQFLVEKKLRPLGVLAGADGSTPELKRADPMLALKFRTALVPEWVVRAITTVFYPLFFPPVVITVLAAIVALDVWLFLVHGVAQSTRELVYQPVLLLMVFGLVVLSAAFHECGHATACRYGGAKPGVMGAGIYLVWPAFYTDVTDAYRLGKGGRLRTDLGGIYFNAIFSLATYGAYFLTGFEPLLVVVVIQHLEILHQLLPFLRLDGYYIVSDLTGVPDMFSRIKPTLRSLLPWKKTDERVEALKPWVRVATSVYVLTLVPLLLLVFGAIVFNAPRIFATAWDSFFVQLDKTSGAFSEGKAAGGAAGIVQLASLALPIAGITLSMGRATLRSARAAWTRTQGRPLARSALTLVGAAAAAGLVYVWLPNGEYKPIQPGERGTLQGAVAQFGEVRTGRPGLPPEREEELGGAPFVNDEGTDPADPGAPAEPSDDGAEEPTDTGETSPTETEPTETTETATTETTTDTTTTTTAP